MTYLKHLCNLYFDSFNEQDIEKLNEMFSSDIILEDWNVNIQGKESVLNEIKNIFINLKNFKIVPINYYEDGNCVCCEIILEIPINIDIEKIQIVDIITFYDVEEGKKKIEKIKAYKI